MIHSGKRFIKNEKFGFQSKRPAQFHSFHHSIRKRTDCFFSDGLHFQKIYYLFENLSVADFFFSDCRGKKTGSDETVMTMNMPGQCHIGQNGHAREKFYVLKSSADAHADKFVSMQMGNVLSVEYYFALLGDDKNR